MDISNVFVCCILLFQDAILVQHWYVLDNLISMCSTTIFMNLASLITVKNEVLEISEDLISRVRTFVHLNIIILDV
jgi:hypothetical protein